MFIFPVWVFLAYVAFYVYWVAVFVYLFGAGTISGSDVVWDSRTEYAMIYHTAVLFWVTVFFTAMTTATLAGAVRFWYCRSSPDVSLEFIHKLFLGDHVVHSLGCLQMTGIVFTVSRSWARAFFYHFGSLALGSFVIALIQFIRWLIAYMWRKCEQAKQGQSCFSPVAYAQDRMMECIFDFR